jgi:plasmid maintenance system antidote protein VapI
MQGKMLKAEAMMAGRRLYQVSAAVGVSPRTLSDILADQVDLTPEMVIRIRQAIWGNQPNRLILESQPSRSSE